MGVAMCNDGSPEAEKIEVFRNYDLRKRMEVAKKLTGIPE